MSEPLRVAVVHSFYSSDQPSGENQVVEAQVRALRDAGHEVELFAVRTDEAQQEPLYRVRTAVKVATGRGSNPLAAVRRFDPDVVHVHNLFPNLGRTWVELVTAPVVHTLHNFRPFCINSFLLRDGAACTECPDGRRWAGVRHRCYRGSLLASIPPAIAIRRGPAADPLLRRADRLLVLSERQREMLVAAGVDGRKIVDGSNFLPARQDPGPGDAGSRAGWLFVGRLSEEKGVLRLLERWPAGEHLTIIGDGPDRDAVERLAARLGAEVLGTRPRAEVVDAMRRSSGLVFPSVWFEGSGAPLVYIEALAAGLPTVAFDPSTAADRVREQATGAIATWAPDGIEPVLRAVRAAVEPLSLRCRQVFEQRYTQARFVSATTALYRELAAAR